LTWIPSTKELEAQLPGAGALLVESVDAEVGVKALLACDVVVAGDLVGKLFGNPVVLPTLILISLLH
jgi:hypothetical protein